MRVRDDEYKKKQKKKNKKKNNKQTKNKKTKVGFKGVKIIQVCFHVVYVYCVCRPNLLHRLKDSQVIDQ